MNGLEIQIKDLNLVLSGNEILEDINLTVKAGEIHCLVGPNGGGKTSLLRCILGQMPFTGSIEMKYEKDKIIGYVPQVLDFERTLPITVEDFMAMTNQMKPCFFGLSKKCKPEVDSLLKKLGVFEKKKRLLGNLSGGERQRVLLAQALFPKPNLLILDEPLTGIDKAGEDYFKEIVKELKEEGITILWIHHNLAQVKELADTVTCIKKRMVFSGDPKEELKEVELIHTPDCPTIESLAKYLDVPLERTVKALTYKDMGTDEIYLVLIRGDFEVNEVKLKNILNAVEVEMATDEEIEKLGLKKGYIGPYKLPTKIKIVADLSVPEISNHIVGSHQKDYHYKNVNYGRDYTADIVTDIRTAKVGENCITGGKLHSARGIECGQIFKLGDKYSKAMNATYLDENGKTQYMLMGCYGIGVTRTMAAAIEQNNDENGIIWPVSIAPYIVDVIPANIKNEVQVNLAEKIYNELEEEKIDAMLDDRDEKPGFKFKDADLIGFPFKVVVGKRADEGIVELKIRKTGETLEVSENEVIAKIKELIKIY